MNTNSLSEWLEKNIWTQIQTMMLNDAYFKLMGRAREITGEFNGPIAGLIEAGYVTSQTVAIRRLCDGRRDVISLRRLLEEAKKSNIVSNEKFDQLSQKLDSCNHICGLVNDYVAHIANPLRKQNVTDWNLQVGHLIEAQRAICEVAVIFDRDLLQRRNYAALIPVPQFDIMQEFRNWVPEASIEKLWEFWHAHNRTVNAWIPSGVTP
ncbi:MAG: hypothetical protein ACLQHK_09740 [Gallionellaceae bacterium]